MKTVFFLLLTLSSVVAQIYEPIDTANNLFREKLLENFKNQNKVFLEELNQYSDKKLRNYYKERYEYLHEELEEEIKEGRVLESEIINNKITEIIASLRQSNARIPNDLRFYVLREGSANAASAGDGTLLINLGLFYYLENEDQIASVLAHEIAHYLLKHTTQNMEQSFSIKKKNKKKVREISKNKYKKAERALKLLKKQLYTFGENSRTFELEADSLGYMLYKKSKYKKEEYINAFKIMELNDTIQPRGLKPNIYKTFFDLPNQPFQEKWLLTEDFSAYNYDLYHDEIDEDSIASHPETNNRINHLKTIYPELKTMDFWLSKPPLVEFKEIKKIATYERVPNMYFNEEYGGAIYITLIELQKNPKDLFYKDWLGKCFMKVYEARKNYTLNRYLDKLIPNKQSISYQKFLGFMWNLSLDEIKNIAEFYSNSNKYLD